MHLNDDPTSAGARPAQPADAGHQGWFAAASPGVGVPTVLQWAFMNTVMAELKNLVEGAGETLDKLNDTQVLQAVQTLADASGSAGGNLPTTTINPTPGHPTTRITFSAGSQRDSTNTTRINLAAALDKKLDAVWAVGTGNGGRDVAGAPAAGQTWHSFLIWGAAVPVDGLHSQSLTNPTLPAGYTKFRRVGSIVLDGSALIRNFLQKPGGFFYYLGGPVVDYANQANAGGPNSRAVTVPQGIKPYVNFHFQSTGTIDNNPYYSGIFDPDHGAPPSWGTSQQRAQVRRIAAQTPGATQYSYETDEFWEWTDRTAHILTYSSDASDVIAVKTRAWQDLDLANFL
ncbi:MAG: hypothetical protein V4466_11985 [Pseudomonadota bacterium]